MGPMLKDGVHDLETYKIMDGMGKKTVKPKYLTIGSSNLKKVKRNDAFKVDVRLCSTSSTCNNWLYQFLNWRRLNIKGDRLVTVMSNIRGSQGIGQFGQDTLVHNNNIPALERVLSIILEIFELPDIENKKMINETFTLFVYVLRVLVGDECEDATMITSSLLI